MMVARKYSSYTINGFNFHTHSYDEGRPVQNSGVVVVAESACFERGRNDDIIIGNKTYYGIIKEIIELNYHHKENVVLFKCDWVDNHVQNKWVKTDQFGIRDVNFKHLFNTGEKISDEPFILASQAFQVFYVPDPIDTEWAAVVQSKPRELYDVDNLENEDTYNCSEQAMLLPDLTGNVIVDIVNGVVPSVRTDIDGENMANTRRNSNDAPVNAYEQQRLATIAENKRKLACLNLPSGETTQPAGQSNKRIKRTHRTSVVPTEGRNLRARPQRNYNKNANGDISEDLVINQSDGDFLCDNEAGKGRGITRLDDIFARTSNMPKIKITLNQHGQPVGNDCRKFSSYIGCLARKRLSVACADWRLVDAEEKYKEKYDIDDAAFNWFLASAGKKWEEFKATLKGQYFNENLTNEELKTKVGDRAHTASAKLNRSKLEESHTSGSKSFACSGYEMEKKLGRPPRRDELYIKTHTRKNEVPLGQSEPIINKLKAIVEARPELKERSIQQGDAFAAVCGEKEPRGRVRVLGLCPTPQDVGTPWYTPTRLQMEVLARKKLQSEKAALEQRIADMQAEIQNQRMERDRQNVEIASHNGSNSRVHSQSPREEHIDDDEAHDEAQFEEDAYADNHCEEHDHLLLSRGGIAPSMQPNQHYQIRPTRANTPARPRNVASTCFSHDELVGEDVILYAMLRSDPVAKGTITSTNPNTMLGDQKLGTQFCEVVVNVVLKRETDLPRPYNNMETMADAYMMPVAWPYKRLKVSKASKSSHDATGM
ncbi:hypothetical protein U9M48_000755, partial [Paspalum notatum var. saurae]